MVRSHLGSTPQVTTGCSDQDWRHPSHISITHVLGSVFIHCYGRPLSTKSVDFLIHKDTFKNLQSRKEYPFYSSTEASQSLSKHFHSGRIKQFLLSESLIFMRFQSSYL